MALLQKMGWRPGEGLGKNKEGTLQPLLLEVKMDKKGKSTIFCLSHYLTTWRSLIDLGTRERGSSTRERRGNRKKEDSLNSPTKSVTSSPYCCSPQCVIMYYLQLKVFLELSYLLTNMLTKLSIGSFILNYYSIYLNILLSLQFLNIENYVFAKYVSWLFCISI